MNKLSRVQNDMMAWFDAGKLLVVEGGDVVTIGSLIYTGKRNTLESLVARGLVEVVKEERGSIRFVYYRRRSG